jgi:hypothetical protein
MHVLWSLYAVHNNAVVRFCVFASLSATKPLTTARLTKFVAVLCSTPCYLPACSSGSSSSQQLDALVVALLRSLDHYRTSICLLRFLVDTNRVPQARVQALRFRASAIVACTLFTCCIAGRHNAIATPTSQIVVEFVGSLVDIVKEQNTRMQFRHETARCQCAKMPKCHHTTGAKIKDARLPNATQPICQDAMTRRGPNNKDTPASCHSANMPGCQDSTGAKVRDCRLPLCHIARLPGLHRGQRSKMRDSQMPFCQYARMP